MINTEQPALNNSASVSSLKDKKTKDAKKLKNRVINVLLKNI